MLTVDQIIAEIRVHAPVGLELPRDPSTNTESRSTMQRWILDAAAKINERRGTTTTKEITITGVEGTQEYVLPEDCREVMSINRQTYRPMAMRMDLGVPVDQNYTAVPIGGLLPSGQEVVGSLALIARQRARTASDENDFNMIGGKIRFMWRVCSGEKVLVTYRAEDRTLDGIGDDRFEMILTYCRYKLLDWWLGKNGSGFAVQNDRGVDLQAATFTRQRNDLLLQWTQDLESIGQESE